MLSTARCPPTALLNWCPPCSATELPLRWLIKTEGAGITYAASRTSGAPSAPISSGQIRCQSLGRKSQRRTAPEDFCSTIVASSGEHGRSPYMTFCKCPLVVAQLRANESRASAAMSDRKAFRFMDVITPFSVVPCQHHTVYKPWLSGGMNDEALIRLENLRKLSLSPAELVNRVGSTYSYWRDLLNGQKSFGEKAARRIEERLELRRGQLDEPSAESQNAIQRAANAWTKNVAVADVGSVRIPLISPVQAGTWTEIVDTFQPGDADEWLLTDTPVSSSTFALQIRGDSMLPKFSPGDRVIIDPEVSPSPGDFVVAKNGDEEATFKKYRPRGLDANGGQVFELVPLNDDFATIRSDQQPVKIIGTMVEHRTYRRPR